MFAKPQLNIIEVLISKALIDLNVSHDEFVSIKKCPGRILWHKRRNQNSNNE